MQTHVVTGPGSGIGEAIARVLRDRGDRLVLVVRDEPRAESLRQEFPTASFVVADLAHPTSIGDALARVEIPDGIDTLIHAAGVVDLGTISELSASSWLHQLTVNVVSVAELTRLLLPALRAQQGHVVCINSGAGLRTHPSWSAYAASKHALKAFADGLRAEESSTGIRVTSVYPGRTATPMQQRVHEQEQQTYDAAQWISPDSVAQTVVTAIDLPRDAHLVDVAVRPNG